MCCSTVCLIKVKKNEFPSSTGVLQKKGCILAWLILRSESYRCFLGSTGALLFPCSLQREWGATVKDIDVAQLSWTCLAGHIPAFPALVFPQRAQEGNCWGRGVQRGARLVPLMVGFPGVEETESLAGPSADRQWTSSWPFGPQALL